jgi:hypothetical protein
MEVGPPNMEVSTIKVKSPVKKKKNKSVDPEAVRKRRTRLYDNEDFKAILAEELEKANGGGECKECRGYAQQCNDALKQQLEVLMDWQLSQKKYSLARAGYETRILDMQDSINSLESCVKLLQEIKESHKRGQLPHYNKFGMKHGQTYTGRKRGRPTRKLVDADGAPLVAKRPAGSEEEEEEEGE